jgi:hypothetical protein
MSESSHPGEAPAWRRVAEHLTLPALLTAVSLYAIGQFQTWKYISAFQIPTTGVEHTWETLVFTGAVSVINLLLNLGPGSLRWLLAAGLLFLVWRLRVRAARSEAPKVRQILTPVLTLALGVAYVFFLLMLGIAWGLENAHALKTYPLPPSASW